MGTNNLKGDYKNDPPQPWVWKNIRILNEEYWRMKNKTEPPVTREAPEEWKKIVVFDIAFFLLTLMTIFHQ